jgi:hypothetical protein
MAMDSLASIAAIVVGASLPIVTLAMFSEWRRRRLASERAAGTRRFVPRRHTAPAAASPRASLAWLGASLGRPASGDSPAETSTVERCPHCHYEVTEASFFCRRCGTRLYHL